MKYRNQLVPAIRTVVEGSSIVSWQPFTSLVARSCCGRAVLSARVLLAAHGPLPAAAQEPDPAQQVPGMAQPTERFQEGSASSRM